MPKICTNRRGAHNKQKYHVSDTKAVKIWMIQIGIRNVDISATTGIAGSTVSTTINGNRANRKVVAELLRRGCPETCFTTFAPVKETIVNDGELLHVDTSE